LNWARGPLAYRNFFLLLTCNVVSVLGTAIAIVAVPFAVLAIGGTAADVGYVTASATVPMVAFLLWGGVVADRLPRHRVMVAANVIQALAQAFSAILVLTGQATVWELMALAAARGTGLGFFFPAAQGLLPQTVPADQLAQANAMDRLGRNISLISGSAVGGTLVGLAGPGWGLAADAASYAIAGALRAGMRFPAVPPVSGPRMLRQLRDGWREFISRRWLWAMVLQFSCVLGIYTGTCSVLGPIVANAHLGGAWSWGVILTAQAGGAVLSGLLLIRLRPRRLLLAASLGVPLQALLLFALAVPLATPAVAAAGFLAGCGIELFGVNWATALQQEIPRDMLSRVSAYDAFGSFCLMPIGAVLAGPLASVLGTAAVLVTGGIVIVALTASVLCLPEVRNLRRHTAQVRKCPSDRNSQLDSRAG
jgi:MFS family permease